MSQPCERLSAARAAIARACLDALPPEPLGDIMLRPDQRRIVARAQRALAEHGGCLIGEDVGRGKTFIALALARRWRRPLVVAPASLRSAWQSAQVRAQVDCAFISHEALSRGRGAAARFDVVIVDEAHHFRNPFTARHAMLARIAASVPIVLLSATPLQNRARDLSAQVALFHGERAFELDMQSLARFIIRGDDAPSFDMPSVAPPEWLLTDADDSAVLAAILDLPNPARPLDGGDAGALRTIALVRAWTSSRAALKAMLRSRRRVATAIAQGLEAGRTPTRREARAWQSAEDAVQLGFAAVLMQRTADAGGLDSVRMQLDADDTASERLRTALASSTNPDDVRVAAIRALRSAHGGSRLVAFSEYASTIAAYFDALRADAGVGMLTSRGARIASGRIPRDDLLARFAPRAQRAIPVASHQAVTLLLTTDLLSEGVNLQDASVVLHLDLPWNPTRLAQRVGRLRRPGGARVVRSFLLAPPAHADALLDAETRLRRKVKSAQHVVGASFEVLPALTSSGAAIFATMRPEAWSATAAGHFVECLERWSSNSGPVKPEKDVPRHEFAEAPMLAAAISPQVGWLAALDDGRVVGALNGAPTDSIDCLLSLARACEGEPRPYEATECASALTSLAAWISEQRVLDTCGLSDRSGALCRAVSDRLAQIIRHARRHEQPVLLKLVSALRDHLSRPMALGAERNVLRDVTCAAEQVEGVGELLSATIGVLNAAVESRGVIRHSDAMPRVVALITIGPERIHT